MCVKVISRLDTSSPPKPENHMSTDLSQPVKNLMVSITSIVLITGAAALGLAFYQQRSYPPLKVVEILIIPGKTATCCIIKSSCSNILVIFESTIASRCRPYRLFLGSVSVLDDLVRSISDRRAQLTLGILFL